MKRNGILFFLASFVLVIASCKKGDTGAQGPAGPNGATGATGPQGPAGPPTTPYASAWIPVYAASWTHTSADSTTADDVFNDINGNPTHSLDTTINFHAWVPMPRLTQKVLDSGHVYIYFKDSTDPKVPIIQWVQGTQVSTGINGIPYSPSSLPWNIYGGSDMSGSLSSIALTPGGLSLFTQWIGVGINNDPRSPAYSPEFLTYKQTPPNTNIHFRYVVFQGSTARMAIHFNKYEEVQKAFGLID